ncbi:MAG: SRPBCC domain-containing protein [Pseudomonadota bacterium]
MIRIIALALCLAGCTTHIPIRTQIDIDVPRGDVFRALTGFESYPDWNPYHVRVVPHGPVAIGTGLDVRVSRPDGKVVDVPEVHILRLETDRELTWGGGIRGVFHGEHVFLLEDLGAKRTRLIHNEDFRGLFIGFADLPPDVLTEGYVRMNEALKAYLEDQP